MMVPEGPTYGTGARGPEGKGEARGSSARSRSPPRVRETEINFFDDKKVDGASETRTPESDTGEGPAWAEQRRPRAFRRRPRPAERGSS